MSELLKAHFEFATDSVDSLTLEEAACHMLAITKFMRTYIDDYNAKLNDHATEYFKENERQKVDDFLSKMSVLLANAKPDSYLYNCRFLDKSDIEKFNSYTEDTLKTIASTATTLKHQAQDLAYKLNEDFDQIVRG